MKGLPALPDAGVVSQSIAAWRAQFPFLGALLDAGLPAADALSRFGAHLLRQGHAADAATVLGAAATLAPEEAPVWTNLGLALDRTGDSGSAGACYERAAALDPRQPPTWLLLGLVRKRTGDLAGAEQAYRAALDIDSSSAIPWQCLGLVKDEQRDYRAAVACFAQAVATGQADAAAFGNLGRLCYQTNQLARARDAYAEARKRDPENLRYADTWRRAAFLCALLEGEPVRQALDAFEAAGAPLSEGELGSFFEGACGQLSSAGRVDVAAELARAWVEAAPASQTAAYLLRALRGDALQRTPPGYVIESFDAFAAGFDAKLVGVLGYDVPEKLTALLQQAITAPADIADVGCGTGLCGPHLRPVARTLVGVDLSRKMLDVAAARGVYDALSCAEVTEWLTAKPGSFDAIAAADLLIYFGDLTPFFVAAATALRPGGLLALSVEDLAGGAPYDLLVSGRFAHRSDYVVLAASPAFRPVFAASPAFRPVPPGGPELNPVGRVDVGEPGDEARGSGRPNVGIETTLRLEGADRVRGNLFLFRRL